MNPPYPQSGYFGTAGHSMPHGDSNITMGGYTDLPPHERPGYLGQNAPVTNPSYDDGLAYGSSPPEDTIRHHSGSVSSQNPPQGPYATMIPPAGTQAPQYRVAPSSATGHSQQAQYTATPTYSQQQQYQYAPPPDKITYTAKPHSQQPAQVNYTPMPQGAQHPQLQRTIPQATPQPVAARPAQPSAPHSAAQAAGARIVDITPGTAKPSTLGIRTRMDRLSVSGDRPDLRGGALPPPSPLLEAYHGTYQSISPMVAPMMLAPDSDLDDLPPLSPVTSHKNSSKIAQRERASSSAQARPGDRDKEKKRVKVYDAEEDARDLAQALSHHKINTETICDILPALSHDQMMELRNEYKKHAKIQGRGINIAKHLNMKLHGNFGKAAYVCALGRWESEGYWANFWYQSHGSRRELLIESLMGRTNAEIRQIKDSFRDKRYNDNLVRCMEKELKADKFRNAVMMVLDERRQEESEVYPQEYRNQDVDILNRCLKSREGGESAMLEIIVKRSDAHLREVLKTYERMYGANFAREALKKSNNLVVSLLAARVLSPR